MNVTCPGCGAIYRVPDERVAEGKKVKVKCKKCGFLVDVAGSSEQQTQAPTQPKEVWYIAVGRERRGPYPQKDIVDMLEGGVIGPETFVWKKGMKDWARLGDVQELAGLLVKPKRKEEQLLVAEAPKPVEELAKTEEQKKPEPMVWQRRETSVLFSLEDYKAKKRSRTEEAVIEVQPVGAEQGPQLVRRPSEKIQVITFDEAEVKKVAEQLRAKKRRKTFVLVGLGIVGNIALVIVAAVIGLKGVEQKGSEALQNEGQMTKPAEVTEQVAVAPKPVVPPSTGSQETKVEPRPAEPAQPVEPPQPLAPKESVDQKGKKTVGKKEEKQRVGPTVEKPAKPPEEKPAPQPQEDINALLAQLKEARGGGAGRGSQQKPEEPKKPIGGTEESLPDQLSSGQIASVMQKGRARIASCLKNAGVPPGTTVVVKTKVEIEGSGRVVSVKVSGAQGAEECIEGVLTNLKFPRFKGANMVVPYPFTVTP